MKNAPVKQRAAGLWRRTPPAVFAPLLGVLGLAVAWRTLTARMGLPWAMADFLAGAVLAAAAFAFLAYATKLLRRPTVLAEELAILPGRAGVGAGMVSIYLLAALLSRYAPELAKIVLITGFCLHLIFWIVLIPAMLRNAGQARITPVWHLNFVGPIVGALASLQVGWDHLAHLILWPMLFMAVINWSGAIYQALTERLPAALRPLLVIHIAPVALIGSVATGLGMDHLAQALGALSALGVVTVLLSAAWLTRAGFSPLWGAFTFPTAATAGFWNALAIHHPHWHIPAVLMTVLATMIVLPILAGIWREWARGDLAVKTNAAIA